MVLLAKKYKDLRPSLFKISEEVLKEAKLIREHRKFIEELVVIDMDGLTR